MFIKFSDKTKKIMVKKSRTKSEEEKDEKDCIFLDDKDQEDRRIKVLSDYDEEES